MFGEITWVSNLKINQNSILNDRQTSLRAYLFLKFIQSSVCTFAITMHEVCFIFYFFVPLKTKKEFFTVFFKEEHDIKMINYNLLFWSLGPITNGPRPSSCVVQRASYVSNFIFFPLPELIGEAKKAKSQNGNFFFNRL